VNGVLDVFGPINASDGNGGIAVLAGNGGVGVRGQGTTVGVQGQGSTGVRGDGTVEGVYGTGIRGVYGEGTVTGVHGFSPEIGGKGVFAESMGGLGLKAVSHTSGCCVGGVGIESFGEVNGIQAWGHFEGVRGVSSKIGILGQIRDPNTPIIPNSVPLPPIINGNLTAGVVGNCVLPSVGCTGIYGYGRAGSGFAHGIVGETGGPNGAGVIGLANCELCQGVRGGTDNPNAFGVIGYNSAGGLAGQFQGKVLVTLDLNVGGNAFKPGGGSWSILSDARLKKSIQSINTPLQKLLQLHGVTYEYANPSAFGELPGIHIGMVAQEVEKVFPSWVDTPKDGFKRITFRGFEAVAVEAIRELNANSKQTMARIVELEQQNAQLRHALELLEVEVKALRHKK
jgi:hypothetical protein